MSFYVTIERIKHGKLIFTLNLITGIMCAFITLILATSHATLILCHILRVQFRNSSVFWGNFFF